MKYAKGICWVDDTRIPFDDEVVGGGKKATSIFGGDAGYEYDGFSTNKTGGRFTPSLLVCDDMLNDGVISKSGGRTISKTEDTNIKNNVYNVGWVRTGSDVKDTGSSSRYYNLDKWFDKVINEIC
jgi:hypothetical protein